MELARFGGDDQNPPLAPGPLLAMVAAAVAGGDGAGLAGVPEEMLLAMICGGRRMSSWGTWLEFSAMRELALRHPAVPRRPRTPRPAPPDPAPAPGSPATGTAAAGTAAAGAASGGAAAGAGTGAVAGASAPADDGRVQFDNFVADEVCLDLRMSWHAAADRISYACDLAGRLPVTFAAMGAGLIDPVHAKIIAEQTEYLSAADAAKADPVLAAAAQQKTYAQLRAAAAKLVLKLDPESAERRRQAGRKNDAHVRPFREDSGNAGMTARELPSDQVLAGWQNIEQRALDLRAAGVPGSLRELRTIAYLDLLQERDSRLTAGTVPDQGHSPADGTASDGGPSDDPERPEGPEGPDPDGGPQDGPGGNGGNGGSGPVPRSPAGTGPDGRARPGSKDTGPCLAALVNLTVPLATALGLSGTPGEAGGFGLLDAATARDLLAAAGRSPHTRWCVTVLYPDGTAAAHGCASGRHPPPPGPEPPGPEPPEPPGPEPPEPPGPEPPEPPGPEPPEPPGPEPPGSPSPGGASPAAPPPPGPAPPSAAGSGSGTGSGGSGGPDQRPPPDTRARDYLRSLRVRLAPIARGRCDHRHAETGYQPSRKLQHLIRTRSTRCTAPGCSRPAARCDLDHTLAWDKGGITCECGLAPRCKR
jgi:hypothetical protein